MTACSFKEQNIYTNQFIVQIKKKTKTKNQCPKQVILTRGQ